MTSINLFHVNDNAKTLEDDKTKKKNLRFARPAPNHFNKWIFFSKIANKNVAPLKINLITGAETKIARNPKLQII